MMSVMTAQPPLPLLVPDAGVIIGAAATLIEDTDGGRVTLHGELVYSWATGDSAMRRLAAAQLADLKAGTVNDISAAFGVEPETLWRWRKQFSEAGVAGLVSDKRGPKGSRILTAKASAEIRRRRKAGQSLRTIGEAVGMSASSVARAVPAGSGKGETEQGATARATVQPASAEPASGRRAAAVPVLPAPADRSGERAAARAGLIEAAAPVFAPAARVPLAGLFLALPALETTGLLSCAREVFGALPNGFYGLETILTESVFRALAGEARAEGATRIDPAALGRVLGLDRGPEVKTIRRKIGILAGTGKAPELLKAIAAKHLHPDHDPDGELSAVLYVDGHVRAYQGGKKIGRIHSTRLKFPAPATEETWVNDATGDPVFVVMAEPGASLAGELRHLLPHLRDIIGDGRRVLVGFDRGGWSPALFKHMDTAGFDTLTWRKGSTADIDPALFTPHTHTDEAGLNHTWEAADTAVEVPVGSSGEVFKMRQITRQDTKTGRQFHILTTRTDLAAGEVIWRMGARWRQENYFRYGRMRFELDSHDSYAATDDDPARSVPNPAKAKAHQKVVAARTRYEKTIAGTDAALLAARTPAPGTTEVLITNADYNTITAEQAAARDALDAAVADHAGIKARLPLGEVHPGQQVLDTDTKLLSHAIRMAAFNTANTLARDIRRSTGYARAAQEAHSLIRQALTGSGDIIPGHGTLTIRLDPLPTTRQTKAISELCEHLTATQTRHPGTDLILRYEVKSQR